MEVALNMGTFEALNQQKMMAVDSGAVNYFCVEEFSSTSSVKFVILQCCLYAAFQEW